MRCRINWVLLSILFTAFPVPVLGLETLPMQLAQQNILQEKLKDFDYWAALCNLQVDGGNYVEGQTACEAAIVLRPKSAITWAEHSNILLKLKKYPESIASADRALKLDPKTSLALTYKCMALAAQKKPDDAMDACTEALRLDGNWGRRSPALAWRYRGLILSQAGEYEKAVLAFDRTLLLEPQESLTLTARCSALIQLDRPQEALTDCQAAIGGDNRWEDKSAAVAWAYQGEAYRRLKQLPQAIAAYDRAIQIDPNDAETWANQGRVLEVMEQPTEALTSFNRSIQLKPNYSLALLGRCAMLNKLQQYKDALTACDLAMQGDGTWRELGAVQAWDQRSVALIGTGQAPAALAASNRATGMKPDFAEAWSNRAVAFWYLGKYDDALQSVNQSIALKPDYAPAWFNQGIILRSQNNYEDALIAYDQAINLTPKVAYIWANRSVILWHLNRFPEALQSADQTIALDPKRFQGWYNRAIALGAMGNPIDAIVAYDRALEINPKSIEAMTGKGMAIVQAGGNKPEANAAAIAILQASLKLNANQPLAKSTLASLMSAKAISQKAEAKTPKPLIDPNAQLFQLPIAKPLSTRTAP